MAPQLSDEQRQALDQCGGRPIEVVHPESHEVYVLITSALYARLRALFDDEEFDVRETYGAQNAALAKVWNDPELDLYNDYDANKPQ